MADIPTVTFLTRNCDRLARVLRPTVNRIIVPDKSKKKQAKKNFHKNVARDIRKNSLMGGNI